MSKRPQAHGSARPLPDHTRSTRRPGGSIAEYGAAIFGGAVLIAAFGFAGHFIGRTAVARNAVAVEASILPKSELSSPVTKDVKGSLLLDLASLDVVNVKVSREQVIMRAGKGDLPMADSPIAEDLPATDSGATMKVAMVAPEANPPKVQIVPASVNIKDENKAAVKRLALAPKAAKVEDDFKLSKDAKQKVIAQRRLRQAEENCLARAVYFEARSESELGQLAVAKVIINRTKTPGFPRTICGVVYQGSGTRNSCQFSFACDGLPDDVRQPAAWARAKQIAQKAMSGNSGMGSAMGLATNYHADYVKPKWSRSMRRLVKIGRHIFYADES